jgi:hypothetical protein
MEREIDHGNVRGCVAAETILDACMHWLRSNDVCDREYCGAVAILSFLSIWLARRQARAFYQNGGTHKEREREGDGENNVSSI